MAALLAIRRLLPKTPFSAVREHESDKNITGGGGKRVGHDVVDRDESRRVGGVSSVSKCRAQALRSLALPGAGNLSPKER